ncbi:hypothetical protein Aperf_G00000110792 [Anoplocephala perfoliata]
MAECVVVLSFRAITEVEKEAKSLLIQWIQSLPGHGKRAIRGDSSQFHFLSGKCERSHYLKSNSREVNWTVLYRGKHKKGAVEEESKSVARSVAEIMAKRNQNSEEKQKAKEAEKKAEKADLKKKKCASEQKQQQPKVAKKVGKPVIKGGKRF